MINIMKENKVITVSLIILILSSILLFFYITRDITARNSFPGEKKIEQTILNYFHALNEKNYKDIAKYLGVSEYHPMVTETIKNYGGRNIKDLEVDIHQEFPNIFQVTVHANDHSNKRVNVYLVVEWTGEKFIISPT